MEITVLIGLFIFFVLYFIPAMVAYQKGRKNKQAILVLNIFLGWTLIGWVLALVWAVSENTNATAEPQLSPRKDW